MPINNEEQAKLNPEPDKNTDADSDKKKIKTKIVFLVLGGLLAGYFIGVEMGFRFIVPYVYSMKTEQILKDYAKPYMEDYIGGDTPEQTIDLFVEALKKEDYDLAVKYFEIQEQPRWIESFKTPNKKNLDEWISELESNKKTWRKEQKDENMYEFWYNTGLGENETTNSIYIRKNIVTNKWKIRSF